MKRKSNDTDILMNVLDYVNSFTINNKRLCTVKDISDGLKITYNMAEKCIKKLEQEGRIITVLRIPRKVKAVLPKEKADVIFSDIFTPAWLENYKLPQENDLLIQLRELQEELNKYQKFKLLLVASGNVLVQVVSYSLEFLGFHVNVTEKEGHHDLEFQDEGFYAIAEVKGLQGHADIEDLRQLIDFHLRKSREMKKELDAYLIVNHYRNSPPNERGPPFTTEVISVVKNSYPFIKLLTTLKIYKLIEEVVRSKISKEYARKEIKSASFDKW